MTDRPMTEGEAEALFDRAVDALCVVYGSPMAASILDGRARLISMEIGNPPSRPNSAADWTDALEVARRFVAYAARVTLDPEPASLLLARALLSTSAAVRGMREWQPIETAPKTRGDGLLGWAADWNGPEVIEWDADGKGTHWFIPFLRPRAQPTHWMPLPESPVLSGIETEQAQARSPSALSASISHDNKAHDQ